MRRADILLLVLLGAIWGTSFMFISMGLQGASPLLFAAVRFDLAGLVSLAIAAAWLGRRALPRTRADLAAIGIAGLLFIAGYHGLLFWGQARTTQTIAAVIVGLNPILTFVFSRLLLAHERLPPRAVLGLGLGFLGVVVLQVLKPGARLDARGWGEVVILLAVMAWSLSTVLLRRTGHSLHPLTLSAWQTLFGALLLHVAALVLEGGGHLGTDRATLGALAYITLVASVGGFLLYYTLLPRLGPVPMNLVSYIVPAFAGVSGLLVLGTPLEPRALFGYVLIAAGFALVVLRTDAPAAPPARAP